MISRGILIGLSGSLCCSAVSWSGRRDRHRAARQPQGRDWKLRQLQRSPDRGRRHRGHGVHPRRDIQNGFGAPSAGGTRHPYGAR